MVQLVDLRTSEVVVIPVDDPNTHLIHCPVCKSEILLCAEQDRRGLVKMETYGPGCELTRQAPWSISYCTCCGVLLCDEVISLGSESSRRRSPYYVFLPRDRVKINRTITLPDGMQIYRGTCGEVVQCFYGNVPIYDVKLDLPVWGISRIAIPESHLDAA